MKNGIFHVTEGKMEQIKNEFDHKTFLVELEGGQIATLNDYFCVMSKKCCFPRKSNMWATYNDWMMDFSWIEKDMSIVIVIYNYDLFMKLDISSKTEIFRGFKEDYIPWWENDVVNHMVDGVPKKFTVYLVD
ncbi:MAG: hypothetical protein ACLTC4_01730 [Hungatella hathewayi]|uniref:hypothetical protein n=2 Tax=Hungatella hathewayi TaxID=154046 RepID=UPI00110ACA9E|nr:hypothetical protein [Hungatella hathewayi]MBS4983596.1 hypothetical protein [Hungatella hathewayi]